MEGGANRETGGNSRPNRANAPKNPPPITAGSRNIAARGHPASFNFPRQRPLGLYPARHQLAAAGNAENAHRWLSHNHARCGSKSTFFRRPLFARCPRRGCTCKRLTHAGREGSGGGNAQRLPSSVRYNHARPAWRVPEQDSLHLAENRIGSPQLRKAHTTMRRDAPRLRPSSEIGR